MASQQLLPPALAPTGGSSASTALLDALISRGLAGASGTPALQSATPLEGYPALPNPDPNSPPPLYGEPPGLGYLYAKDPEFRQASLVETDPEIVRKMILRAMEVAASNALLPFNQEGVSKNADALLRMAQAYLLIDPSVDAEGVPVASKILTSGAPQVASAAARPIPGGGTPLRGGKGESGEAHGDVKKGLTVGQHAEPPRVVAGAAAQLLQKMHQNAEEVLKGARGSRPLPRPRPSA